MSSCLNPQIYSIWDSIYGPTAQSASSNAPYRYATEGRYGPLGPKFMGKCRYSCSKRPSVTGVVMLHRLVFFTNGRFLSRRSNAISSAKMGKEETDKQSQAMNSFFMRPIARGSNTESSSLSLSRHLMVVELYLRPGIGMTEGAVCLTKSTIPLMRPPSRANVYALVITFSVNG